MPAKKSSQDNSQGEQIADKELSERKGQLDQALSAYRSQQQLKNNLSNKRRESGFSYGLKLASEFIAGPLTGGFLGFCFDYFFATSPWGVIFFVILGFAAGILNIIRASNP